MTTVNREEFERVAIELEAGQDLTLEMVGRVFGNDFWVMTVYLLMDAQDAARAIQGAINRLSREEAPSEPEVS
jgi:hypothetical protein